MDYEPFYNDNQVSQSNRGVYNVQISTTVNDAETGDIVNAALAQAESDFGVSSMNSVSDYGKCPQCCLAVFPFYYNPVLTIVNVVLTLCSSLQ